MRITSAIGAILLTLLSTGGTVAAVSPVAYGSVARPSIRITSISASSRCVTVRVAVSNFRLVKPDFRHTRMLKGNQGHIHYLLNGGGNFRASRDATSQLSHTWCGSKQGVKHGRNVVTVFLATAQFRVFPGTRLTTRPVMKN